MQKESRKKRAAFRFLVFVKKVMTISFQPTFIYCLYSFSKPDYEFRQEK